MILCLCLGHGCIIIPFDFSVFLCSMGKQSETCLHVA
ncbi:hypothetical protein GLYMA_01G105851v4 [Glycine max]|nr:hypothetical protein GLYMA_01G105851v4 [Glycine max]KAH1162528.1 hypothetical protein GYH30_001141 [Glycine max]